MVESNPVDMVWTARRPIEPASTAKRFGKQDGPAGLRVRVDEVVDGCELLVRDGAADAFAEAAQSLFGAGAGVPRSAIFNDDIDLVWCGAGRYLAVALSDRHDAFRRQLAVTFAGLAALSPQSDSRVIFTLNGNHVRDMLARLIPLDVDPRAFPVGQSAATVLGHVPVLVWRGVDAAMDNGATFHIAVSRSYAETIWHDLITAGRRFGVEAL